MKRQNIRKLILIISLLLFPLTIYYFSPYLIIQGASEGIITGSFIVFSSMFFGSLFLGRVFCGWLCPAGGAGECMMLVNDKRAKGGRLNYIKYAIWVPWLAGIVAAAVYAGGFRKADFFYMTQHGISVSNPGAYIIYYAVLLLIVILSLTTGRRGFCHYSCWMAPFMIIGTRISDKINIPHLHLKADKEKCISCMLCTKNCPMSLEVEKIVKSGSMKNDECILCAQCIDVCPKSVISYIIGK